MELLPPGSIPKTSSGKLRREETKRLYLEGQLAAPKRAAWMQMTRLGGVSALRSAWQALKTGIKLTLALAYSIYAALVFSAWIVVATSAPKAAYLPKVLPTERH